VAAKTGKGRQAQKKKKNRHTGKDKPTQSAEKAEEKNKRQQKTRLLQGVKTNAIFFSIQITAGSGFIVCINSWEPPSESGDFGKES
jgi:hypothetical protein